MSLYASRAILVLLLWGLNPKLGVSFEVQNQQKSVHGDPNFFPEAFEYLIWELEAFEDQNLKKKFAFVVFFELFWDPKSPKIDPRRP